LILRQPIGCLFLCLTIFFSLNIKKAAEIEVAF
jgi:hypothetical protein